MKRIEPLLLSVLFIGWIADFFLVPYAQWIFYIAVGLLANVYLFDFEALAYNKPLQEYNNRQRYHRVLNQRKMLPGYGISSMLIGFLFNYNSWPGSIFILSAGASICIFAGYTLWQDRATDPVLSRYGIIRLFIALVCGGVLYSLPSYFWLDQKYKSYPEYIEARKAFEQDPENETLRTRMEEEYAKIGS
jgi:hypothetical protein